MIKFIISTLITLLATGPVWSARTQIIHMGRQFALYVPNNTMVRNLPMVVLLHGCAQSPAVILDGTSFEKAAEKHKFIILAPMQPKFANIYHCWNWFLDFQQQRNFSNEMGQIVSAVDLISNKYQLDPNRIFVAGLSAGGVMAHNLSVCYPDVFSGGAIHSGLNYKSAENVTEAETVLTRNDQKSPEYLGKKMAACARQVPNHRMKKVLIIHGAEDHVVPTLHPELITKSQSVWRDILDDGRRNDSIRGIEKVTQETFPDGYSAIRTDVSYPGFNERKIMVKGLGHAWGGGKEGIRFFDPKAPSSTQFIIEFFNLNK